MAENINDLEFENISEEDTGYLMDELLSPNSKGLINVLTTLNKRINDLEHKVFINKKTSITTRAQQMLLLKHLGMIEKIDSLNMKVKDKAKLLSFLLNVSYDNIKKDLETIHNDSDSDLMTEKNYEFLYSLFKEIKLTEKTIEIELILDKIKLKKSKRK